MSGVFLAPFLPQIILCVSALLLLNFSNVIFHFAEHHKQISHSPPVRRGGGGRHIQEVRYVEGLSCMSAGETSPQNRKQSVTGLTCSVVTPACGGTQIRREGNRTRLPLDVCEGGKHVLRDTGYG